MTFQPRPSRASQIWAGIIFFVLLVLFFETRDHRQGDANFFLSTNDEAVGAAVVIDNRKAGAVESGSAGGLGGGVFRTHLGSGEHTIQLEKNGFQPLSKRIEIQREAYLGVDLQPTTH